jgi:hypothetical protein
MTDEYLPGQEEMFGDSAPLPKVTVERRFPVQACEHSGHQYPAFTIPWTVAELAYRTYVKLAPEPSRHSLQQLADRGGFGQRELLYLLSGGSDDRLLKDSETT